MFHFIASLCMLLSVASSSRCKVATKKILYETMKRQYAHRFLSTAHNCIIPKHVSLTYDDSVSEFTPLLLDILRKYGIRATFFILGKSVYNDKRFQMILKRMICEGHLVAAHSWDHKDLTQISTQEIYEQILKSEDTFTSILGFCPRIFRPPYGYMPMMI